MDVTTINQIIESCSIIVASFIVIKIYSNAVKWKFDVNKEITLLKDIQYFRNIIDQYREYVKAEGIKSNINKFRNYAAKASNHDPSHHSKPSVIKKRIKKLENQKKSINELTRNLRP